jgi:hypothetical protein
MISFAHDLFVVDTTMTEIDVIVKRTGGCAGQVGAAPALHYGARLLAATAHGRWSALPVRIGLSAVADGRSGWIGRD